MAMLGPSGSCQAVMAHCGLFLLAVALLLLNFHVVVANAQPVDTENRDVEEKADTQQPGYDSSVSIQALNLSSSESTSPPNSDQFNGTPDKQEDSVSSSEERSSRGTVAAFTREDGTIQLGPSGSTAFPDADPTDLVTSPRIEVISKTITSERPAFSDAEEKEEEVSPAGDHHQVNVTAHESNATSVSGAALEAGDENTTVEAEADVDIFDKLMTSIHEHWLEFVGKMKLSVVDVWKSISNHMMDRLENFATSL